MLIILNIGTNQEKNNMMARVHIFVRGLVQGVYFRHYTRITGRETGVTGWVRNLEDGRVEVVCEGTEEQIAEMIEWCRTGPAHARVDGMEVRHEEYTGEFKAFDVRY